MQIVIRNLFVWGALYLPLSTLLAQECQLEPYCYALQSAPNHRTFGITLALKKGEESPYPDSKTEIIENIDSARSCFDEAIKRTFRLETLTRKHFDPSLADAEDYIETPACFPFVRWTYTRRNLQRSGKVSFKTKEAFEQAAQNENVVFNYTGDQRYKIPHAGSDKIVPLISPEPFAF